jgi:PIN domain nuclease of toxin-antitoxin system
MIHVADTHALVWFLEGSDRLSAAARQAMQSLDIDIVVPSIVLAEIVFLYGRRRIGTDLTTVLEHVSRTDNCTIYPLDETVVEHLPIELDIHDAVIVATALVFRDVLGKDVALITKDARIRQSNVVKTLW